MLTDATCTRGVGALQQVRRSYIKITKDEKGRDTVRVRGYVNTKNNQGRSVNYTPMDKTIYGQYEVNLFKFNFDHNIDQNPDLDSGQSCL